MNTFKEDLELAERFELFVCRVSKIHFGLDLHKNEDVLGVDLLGAGFCVEVKYDKQFNKTGNFFIEYLYKGERSGILKYDADYFCIGDENRFWIFDRMELFNMCLVFGNKVTGGDNNNSTGYLIKYEEVIDLAYYKYKRYGN